MCASSSICFSFMRIPPPSPMFFVGASFRSLHHSTPPFPPSTPLPSFRAEINNMGGGEIKRFVLNDEGRTKLNSLPDRDFYSFPRFVTHVDDGFLSILSQLYRERIPPNSEVFDLMSSWVSHLPAEVKYKRVIGHGLNVAELARNKRLDYFFVRDLNEDPKFELASGSFNAVLCAVSVQYLQQPEKVFAEIYRILRPGGVCIVSFSNRMFYDKAIAAWRDGTPFSRTQLVVQYFQSIVGFTQPEVVKQHHSKAEKIGKQQQSVIGWLLDLLQPSSNDPLYAVIAYRNFKPL